jgi:carbonic anhydrase
VANGQRPFAVIVSCSDSRVPPEIIFDQGIGNLFVVRCAGNIVDDAGLGSIEYAAEHLHVSLIVVLGHERCGAVEAAVKGGEAPGHIKSLVEAIRPAVEKVKGRPGDLAENAMRGNVKLVVDHLKASKPILEHLVHKGTLSVIGARYDLDDGHVILIP